MPNRFNSHGFAKATARTCSHVLKPKQNVPGHSFVSRTALPYSSKNARTPPTKVDDSLWPRHTQRRHAATAAQPAGVQGSNLPPEYLNTIQHEANLPNPDPPADSQTAQMVSSTAPYMVPTYVRPPPVMVKGDGCVIYDVENRAYLDFTAGIAVTALGHCDPEVTRIISSQASTLIHSSNLYHNPWTGLLGQRLVERTIETGGMRDAAKVFASNSGGEANEAAIKFARKWGFHNDQSGKKTKILSFHGSFHGRTMGALSATPNPKYQRPFAPMIPGFEYATLNSIEESERMITDETCGVLIEPIQGEGGVNVATPEFLRALRRKCDQHNALLIFDEIQCGMGRTGNFWAHSYDQGEGAPHPDVLTTAKALGNGYPVGATIVTDRVANAIVTGDHGTTFGGNPLAARVAHHMVGRLSEEEMLSNVTKKGDMICAGVQQLAERFPGRIREVRGRGLILGVQLEPWREGEEKESEPAAAIVSAARERGLLVITCGSNTLRLVPPLIIDKAQINQALNVLGQAMATVYAQGNYKDKDTPGQQEMGSG